MQQKKNEIMLFAAMWVNLGFIMLSEVSETEEQYHHVTYGQNIKYDTNEPIYKIEPQLQRQKTNLRLPEWKVGETNQKFGVSRYYYIYKIDKQQILLDSTGNYIQNPVRNHNGRK